MIYKKVLITCGSSNVGLSIIKCLSTKKGIKLVVLDENKYSAGLHMGHKGYVIPYTPPESYIERILSICKKESIDVIFPAFHPMLLTFAENKEKFEAENIKVILSDVESIRKTVDKFEMYNLLSRDICMPETTKLRDYVENTANTIKKLPLMVKPQKGFGSLNIHIIDNPRVLKYLINSKIISNISDYLIQKYIAGTEYSIDVLCEHDGNILTIVPRERISILNGVSSVGKTIHSTKFSDVIKTITHKIKFFGPINFQFIESKEDGKLYLIEINARSSGSTVLSKEAGVNIPYLALKLIFNEKTTEDELEYKPNIIMSRYFNEIYFEL